MNKIGLLLLTSVFGIANAQPSDASRDAQLKWFDDARFGMFIHWGVYAVPAGEWQGKTINHIGEWIMLTEQIPVPTYKSYAESFNAAKYDPVAWAKLAKDAGMKYVVITSKHHDGFALYDSAVTDWDVMNSGAKRDLLTPLAEAVRAEGLKFGLYYSQAQDWTHPGGAMHKKQPWDPAQKGNYDDYLKNIALPQVKEIVEKFDPAIIWWDTPEDMTKERVKPFSDYITQFPQIINNNRLGAGFAGDTKTPEQNIPPRGYPGERFEVCMTMNNTWGFKIKDNHWKSLRLILQNLSDISSKGGNFLLNVGPTAEGVIPPESIALLEGIGRWMKVNSEAIYGTTSSPFPRRLPWGRVTTKASGNSTTLYAHVWQWPGDGKLLLPSLKETPVKATLLAGGEAIKTQNTSEGLVLQHPPNAPDPDVSVVRLDFADSITITMPLFPSPDENGRVTFGGLDADPHGYLDGNFQLRDSGPNAYLTEWKNPAWTLEYLFKAPQAQKWLVNAEVSATSPVNLTVEVGKVSTPARVPATGPDLTWKTVPLAIVELPAGQAEFKLKGVANGWKPISVRKLWLDPVTSDTSDPSYLSADDQGVLKLNAVDAKLTGKLAMESAHAGFWTNPQDTVTWRAAVAKAGAYEVSLDFGCHDDAAGSEFEVKIGSKTLLGKVTGTGTWKEFKTEVLGSVDLEKSNEVIITVKATKKPGEAVMNLRSLTLTPRDSVK